MSFFSGDIEFGPETEQFRDMLDEWAEQMQDGDKELLERISDQVFSELGQEAIDEGRQIPLSTKTKRNKDVHFGRVEPKRFRHQHRTVNRRKEFTGYNPSPTPLAQSPGGDGLVSALTAPFALGKHSRSADRDISGDRLNWGTKGKINYAHPHVFGSRLGLPARLSLLDPKRFEPRATEMVLDVIADWLGSKLEKAGAPASFIQEVTEGRF